MNEIKISLSFRRLSAVLTAVFGQSILTAMTNNTNFTAPYPALSLLQTALTNLNIAIAAHHSGDKASTAAVNAAKRQLNRVLKALAYIEFESDTDDVKALSSGFSLVASRQAVATVFSAVQGLQSGSVDVSSPAGGSSYIWAYTGDPIVAANWLVAGTTTQSSFTINGLTPGTKYWFRVALVTSAGQQPWENPMMVHVI